MVRNVQQVGCILVIVLSLLPQARVGWSEGPDSTLPPASKHIAEAEKAAPSPEINQNNEDQPAPSPPPEQSDSDPDGQMPDVIQSAKIQELREQGDQAFRDMLYDIAEKFYREYWDHAYDADMLIEAGVRIIKTHLARNDMKSAFSVIDEIYGRVAQPDDSDAQPNQIVLSAENEFTIRFWLARCHLLNGDAGQALATYQEIYTDELPEPLRSDTLLGVGDCHIALGDWNEAEKVYNQVIAAMANERSLNRAHLGLIEISIVNGEFTHASELIESGWENSTGEYREKLGMLKIALLLGEAKPGGAYKLYTDLFSGSIDHLSDISNYPILRKLGTALMDIGQFDESLALFRRLLPVLKLERHKKEVLIDIAGVHDAKGDRITAISRYKRYLELYPQDPMKSKFLLRIGRLYEELDKTEDAVANYNRVYEDDGNTSSYRYDAANRMAWIYRNGGKFEKAVKYFYESSTFGVADEEKARGVFFAAETYNQMTDYNSAAMHYQSVADTYPNSRYAAESRYKQAQARFSGKRYRMAAEAFDQYLKTWPDGEFREDGLLNKGIAERMAEDYTVAIDTLEKFIQQHPESRQLPFALLQASQSAAAADMQPAAIGFLTKVVTDHAGSEHFPYALYRRAFLQFSYGLFEEALTDSLSFVERFGASHPKLAANVYLWLGDHYANNRNYARAERMFLEVSRRYGSLPDAPVGLYEAAKCAFNVSKENDQDYNKALAYIVQLLTGYADAPARVRAQAQFLRGDIASINGDFNEAIEWFQECADLVPRTDLHYSAIGRLGECYYSLATVEEEPAAHYQQALSHFNTIIAGNNVKYALIEMARYRAAKIYELMKQPDRAIEEYFHIFFKADYDYKNRRIVDWYYFARAGFDLARLYMERNEYSSAKTIYNRMAESNIPISEEARLRAEQLDDLYLTAK